MANLFNILPEGCFHLAGFVSDADQGALVGHCRDLCTTHPLMHPTNKYGYPMALKVTSWGQVGWFGQNGVYQYMDRHANECPWPPIPHLVDRIMAHALAACNFQPFPLDTVLMNWYPPETGRLGKHQDVTEQDHYKPIVTISLGSSCEFAVGNQNYDDPMQTMELRSGDVFVMGGQSRLAYHEVRKLIPGTSKLLESGGRISLTGRKVFR